MNIGLCYLVSKYEFLPITRIWKPHSLPRPCHPLEVDDRIIWPGNYISPWKSKRRCRLLIKITFFSGLANIRGFPTLHNLTFKLPFGSTTNIPLSTTRSCIITRQLIQIYLRILRTLYYRKRTSYSSGSSTRYFGVLSPCPSAPRKLSHVSLHGRRYLEGKTERRRGLRQELPSMCYN